MAKITFVRPSGSFIEVENTKELRAKAKELDWKIKKEQKQTDLLSGDDDGNSGPGSEGDTSGNSGAGE